MKMSGISFTDFDKKLKNWKEEGKTLTYKNKKSGPGAGF